jgi:hypothetical protein
LKLLKQPLNNILGKGLPEILQLLAPNLALDIDKIYRKISVAHCRYSEKILLMDREYDLTFFFEDQKTFLEIGNAPNGIYQKSFASYLKNYTNQLNLKFLYRDQCLLYAEIHLNSIAIKMANLLALRQNSVLVEKLWKADQDYGRWCVDSQLLRSQHQKALHLRDYERADMLWARYCESRDRTVSAKQQAERLL